jgi:MFS family permease
MIAGFGEGYVSAIWAELARITTEEERTRYFALLKVSYLLGLVLGPALNLFLMEFDFYIGN